MAKGKQGTDAENSAENSGTRRRGKGRPFQPGNPYRFKPGEVANPTGRPRKPLTDAYKLILDQPFPGDPKKRTYAQLIAEGQAKAAIKGKSESAKEIADRVEGKVRQEITGPEGGAIPVADVNVHDKLASLADRLLDRIAKRTAKTLSREQIQLLDAEEAEQYLAALEEYERWLDMQDLAAGLTIDLAEFIRQAWSVIEPTTVLSWSWHYELLSDWLTLIAAGEFKQRYPNKLGLIINVPPRSAKSSVVTVMWPVWSWLRWPSRRFLFASHSNDLSVDHNAKRRQLIASPWFRERFGDRFSLVTEGAALVRNNHTGQFFVTSVGSKNTGFGGNICVGDDLLDRKDQWSATTKKSTNSWIDNSFSNLLNNRTTDVFVHISQRLAVDDPTGHLLGEDESTGRPEQVELIKIKRQSEQEERYVFPLSGHVHVRPKGDVLQPDRTPPSILRDLKAKAQAWANQEQQEPTPRSGAILNPNHLRTFQAGTALPTFYQVVISVDCAFKAHVENDLVAIHKYALVGNRKYLLDRRTDHLGFTATKQGIKDMARGGQHVSWLSVPMPAATQCLIENKANGPAITEQLRDDPEFKLAIIEYNPVGSKDQRFIAAAADAEGGLIYVPADAPWIGALLKILTDYAGEGSIPHDDDCDAFSQLVNWSRVAQYGLLGYLDKLKAAEQEQATHRYEYVDELTGATIVLEFDTAKQMWVGPNGEEYPPAPEEVKTPDESSDAAEG